MISNKLVQLLIDHSVRRAISNGYKSENRGPNGTIVANMENGDCLKAGAYPTYGNRAPIVITLKGGRKCSLKLNSQYNGFRCYSKQAKASLSEGNLPRKFEKLVQICAKPKENFKVNDIYRLMFNVRMYEVAYQKLKSNPGNMTPGINPVTLDGLSME